MRTGDIEGVYDIVDKCKSCPDGKGQVEGIEIHHFALEVLVGGCKGSQLSIHHYYIMVVDNRQRMQQKARRVEKGIDEGECGCCWERFVLSDIFI